MSIDNEEHEVDEPEVEAVEVSDSDDLSPGESAFVLQEASSDDDPEESKPTRAEKKSNRFREMQEERDALRSEMEELRREVRENRQPAVQTGSRQRSPQETELAQLENQRQALAAKCQAEIDTKTITKPQMAKYEQAARLIEERKADLRAEGSVARLIPKIRQEAADAAVRNRYSDVNANRRAAAWAKGHWQMLTAKASDPVAAQQDHGYVEKAMEAARVEFGIGGKKPAPTKADKSRYTSTGTNSSGANKSSGTKIVMTKAQKKMAHSKYSHMDEADAEKEWAKTTGRRVKGLHRN